MKVLHDHQSPFLLTRGGHLMKIEQTMQQGAGIEAEHFRSWDDSHSGDVMAGPHVTGLLFSTTKE